MKKGISLIVLVITIIVMIIIAGAIIISLNSTNVLNQANTAVDASNEAELKAAVALEYMNQYVAYWNSLQDPDVADKDKPTATSVETALARLFAEVNANTTNYKYTVQGTTDDTGVVGVWVQREDKLTSATKQI